MQDWKQYKQWAYKVYHSKFRYYEGKGIYKGRYPGFDGILPKGWDSPFKKLKYVDLIALVECQDPQIQPKLKHRLMKDKVIVSEKL